MSSLRVARGKGCTLNDDEIVAELMSEASGDWLMAHDIVWASTRGVLDESTKRTTLRILGRLFREGVMVPGDLGVTGFEDWPGGPIEWLRRSEADLNRLRWKPMGAGFWLRLTDDAEAVARKRRES